MTRRGFLKLSAAASAQDSFPLDPWRPGTLDIHHLAYGRGNSTFILCPDGTTILIDAGTTKDALSVSCAQKPDTANRPGEWIANYVLRQMQPAGRRELDYALITHIHPDHVGDLGPENPPSRTGGYRLTGLMDVAAKLPVRMLIDRGFPDYDYPQPSTAPFAENYRRYVRSRQKLGELTERLKVGSAAQIRPTREARRYPRFVVRNLAANGEVWTGEGERTHETFPPLRELRPEDYPSENMCSAAIRLSYGKFDYFTGGDLPGDIDESGVSWRDIETPVARAAGPVDVAVAGHHAYFDAVGPGFVRALRPKVFIVPAWYVAHLSILPLRRMLDGQRDVFATCVMDANRSVNNQFIGKLKSTEGHVIVRVDPGGDEFRVIVTDNSNDRDRVKFMAGPYRSD